MKSSRRATWCIFAVCALLVTGGLGWATWQMLRLERREQLAQQLAAKQETLRLALWRMDSTATPLIAQESARPYFEYRAFYPAERAYTRMWEEVLPGEVLVPSPLLRGSASLIRLHFEIDENGVLSSPQAPKGNMRDRAEGEYVDPQSVIHAEQLLRELAYIIEQQGLPPSESPAESRMAEVVADELRRGEGAPPPAPQEASKLGDYQARQQFVEDARMGEGTQAARNDELVRKRQEALRRIANDSERASTEQHDLIPVPEDAYSARAREPVQFDSMQTTTLADDPAAHIITGPFEPFWRTDPSSGRRELLFMRNVTVNDRSITQGFWIDWPRLRDALIARINDLLPAATLEPVSQSRLVNAADSPADSGELLASIPARLIPSQLPESAAAPASTLRLTLGVTWAAAVTAMLAIGLVLRASMAMSERRGRFVSAVTHELRTPMTTFCLYSQMLADGMIRDEQRKGEYLSTLKQESQRLARIVENVLAFARLGRRQAAKARSTIALSEIIDKCLPNLRTRAEQAGMTLLFEPGPAALEARVPEEREGISRIVLNLVDNACKYASGADDKRIHLRIHTDRTRVLITVIDHGPGVPRSEQRRIFAPFRRAKRDDAGPNPGLGLGLALARGLARELGGELRLVRIDHPGAAFELSLPTFAG